MGGGKGDEWSGVERGHERGGGGRRNKKGKRM